MFPSASCCQYIYDMYFHKHTLLFTLMHIHTWIRFNTFSYSFIWKERIFIFFFYKLVCMVFKANIHSLGKSKYLLYFYLHSGYLFLLILLLFFTTMSGCQKWVLKNVFTFSVYYQWWFVIPSTTSTTHTTLLEQLTDWITTKDFDMEW